MKDLRTIAAAMFLMFSGTTLEFSGTTLENAQGAGNEWDILNQEVMNLYQQRKYDRATIVAQKALEVAERNAGPDHPDVAKSLNNLAVLCYTHGDDGECDVVAQSISMSGLDSDTFSVSAQATLGPSDEPLPGDFNGDNIVDAHDEAILKTNHFTRGGMTRATGDMDGDGDVDDSDYLRFKRAERTYRTRSAKNFGAVATTCDCALDTADYTKADALYKRSQAIAEKSLGLNHPTVATIRGNLAVLYYTQGFYAKAEPLLKRSLAIREESLGQDHPDVATGLNNLAVLYYTQGAYTKAKRLFKRSLAIKEKASGPDHPSLTISLSNLAELYRTLRGSYYHEARHMLKRSLAIDEKAFGPDHPSLATSLNNLAVLYYTKGDYAMAQSLLERLLAIREESLGQDHPDVATSLSNLASLHQTQAIHDKQRELVEARNEVKSQVLRLEKLINKLSDDLQNADKEALEGAITKVREAAQGEDAAAIKTAIGELVQASHAIVQASYAISHAINEARYAKAESLLQRSLAIREKSLGPDHAEVATSLNNLAGLYRATKRLEEAEKLEQRAAQIRAMKP